MATNLSAVFLLCGILIPFVTAGDDCEAYLDSYGRFVQKKDCGWPQTCCGSCDNRYCCLIKHITLSEAEQERCSSSKNNKVSFNMGDPTVVWVPSVIGVLIIFLIIMCCCLCPCCCCYHMCREPRPMTTHTTVVNTQFTHQPQYPNQPIQAYQGGPQYPAYQPMPIQPGYAAGQPMPSTPAYQPQPFQPGPPPPYQEGCYPPAVPVPYSQAAFGPGQSPYPLQPLSQPGAPPMQSELHSSQPAYNPAYVNPKSGY
ncbi:hypothetical protein UPYG_G00092070 [Umbra pygmaea]|uniref:Protein shisa-5 n=1 Tax=Umbra pygmaea TaxID=75934 RepID=A0ABD0XG14_UMBPY